MSEILKAADAPLPTNGQMPTSQPMTVAEATEKLVTVMDHMKASTDNEIEDIMTCFSNLKQQLALQSAASQAEVRKLGSLMLAIKEKVKDAEQIAQQIAKNHLQ